MILHSLSTLFYYNTHSQILWDRRYYDGHELSSFLFSFDEFVFCFVVVFGVGAVGLGRVFKLISVSNLCTEGTGLFNPGGRRINII